MSEFYDFFSLKAAPCFVIVKESIHAGTLPAVAYQGISAQSFRNNYNNRKEKNLYVPLNAGILETDLLSTKEGCILPKRRKVNKHFIIKTVTSADTKDTSNIQDTQNTQDNKINTYWDQMAKKLLKRYPRLLLPVLNKLFRKRYGPNTRIQFLETEHIVENQNGETHPIRNDLTILVNDTDLYHLEFQRTYDTSISCRFLEYDVQVTLLAGTSRKSLTEDEKKRNLRTSRNFYFTRPAPLLFNLTHAIMEPELYENTIESLEGEQWNYPIQVVNIQQFTLEEIEESEYYFLIPFLPLRYYQEFVIQNELTNVDEFKNELTLLIKSCRTLLNKNSQSGYLGVSTSEELWTNLLDACFYLFGDLKNVLEEIQMNIGSNFYFRDEAYAIVKNENQKLLKSLDTMKKNAIQLNSALAEKDSALAEKDSALAEKDSVLAEKDSALAEKDSALAEKDFLIQELQKYSFLGIIQFMRKLRNHLFLKI